MLVIGYWLGLLGLFETIVFIFVFLCCLGFTFPNASALSMGAFSKNAGSASALMGAAQMGFGALATVILSLFEAQSAVPMACIMMGSTLLALLILVVGKRTIPATDHLHKVEAAAGMIH